MRYISQIASDASVLEIGCGAGLDLLLAQSFKLTAIDVSFRSVRAARSYYGERARICQMDAHRTAFRSESFDVVLGRSVLHHLEYDCALLEVRRILKNGGLAMFVEPLFDNPMSRIWRALTPRARTIDELPLSKKQIIRGNALFAAHDHRFINLVSTPVAMLTSLTLKRANNLWLRIAHQADLVLERGSARYWMRTVYLVWKK